MNCKVKNKDNEDNSNYINVKILDSILDDDDETFFQLVSQNNSDDLDYNKHFKLTIYKLPLILSDQPPYSSLCAAFGAEKCFNSLLSLFPEGIQSKHFNKTDGKGRHPIHFACFSGNINILRLYYQAKFDFNISDFSGKTASHYSAISGTLDAIKYLFTKGFDIRTKTDHSGMTPFHIACKYGNKDVVKFLTEKVANDSNQIFISKLDSNLFFDSKSYHNKYCMIETPLHLACESGCSEIVDYILNTNQFAKFQINMLNKNSQTPLDCAIQNGNFECVKSLIGKVKIQPRNRKHVPIVDASAYGYTDIVLLLLRSGKIDINAVNSQKINALDAAILNNHLDIVKLLIEKGICQNSNEDEICHFFIEALGTINLEIVKYLDSKLNIPYSKMGSLFMKQAVMIEDESLVSFLLDKKCNFDGVDKYVNFRSNWTPFMSFLKEKGFDFNNIGSEWSTPLIVKSIRHGNLKSVKKLISEGIELNKDLISKFDCIQEVCALGKIDLFNFLISYEPENVDVKNCIVSLIEKSSQPTKKSNKKLIEDCIKIAETLIDRYKFDVNKESVICSAVYNCSIEFLEFFEKYSVDFNKFEFDYSKMVKKEFLTVFKFLEKNGCCFQKVRRGGFSFFSYFDHLNKKNEKVRYKISPVMLNISTHYWTEYDVNTLVFLIKYAENDDLIYSNYNNKKNIINILILFDRFDAILNVYRKLNGILYPLKKSKEEFEHLINNCGNEELISFVQSHEKVETEKE